MKEHIGGKRSDLNLTYQTLIREMFIEKMSYESLRFASSILREEIRKGFNNIEYDYKTELGEFSAQQRHNFEKNKIFEQTISTYSLQTFVKSLKHLYPGNETVCIDNLTMTNARFIRTRFVNAIYEILQKYWKEHDKYDGTKYLHNQLKQKDWFRILYFIRNNASHADSLNSKVDFRTTFLRNTGLKTIKWNEIEVVDGMNGPDLRYSDNELLDLFDEMLFFITKNESLFTTRADGSKIIELLQ